MLESPRDIYELERNPAGPSVLDYPPAPESGVPIEGNEKISVNVQLRNDSRRRTTLIDVVTVASSEDYGLTVDGTSITKTSSNDANDDLDILELVERIAQDIAKPVWPFIEDVDEDGDKELRLEEGWSKYTVSTVSNDTDYSLDVTYTDGWTTTTDQIIYHSASSGATASSILAGLRTNLNASSVPVVARVGDIDDDSSFEVLGVAPASKKHVSFSPSSNLAEDAAHGSSLPSNLSVSDNSTGTNADLRVVQEATSATFGIMVRHAESGDWSKVNNLESVSKTHNWSEVVGSLEEYDRIDVDFASVDGRVGAYVTPAGD